jgi:hypothetical protein
MANIIFSEASGVNDSIVGKSQAPIRQFIEKRGEAFEQESVAKALFKVEKSTHFGEKFTSLTAMDGFQVAGENGAYPTDGMEEGYSKVMESVEWKDSFSISKKIIEDSQMMELRKKPAAFVTAYYRTREKFAAALLGSAVQGNSSVKFAGGKFDLKASDGQNLFYASHPSKVKGGTQCNLWSDAFSDDALGMLETKMQNTRGDNGEILDVAPDTILIPNIHSLKKAVFAAIGADKEPTTANNAFNYQYGRWSVIIWPYLNQFITAGSSPWALIDPTYNENYGGAVWNDRVPLTITPDVDKNTDAAIWRGRSRFNATGNDWRFIAVGGIASGTTLS